MKIQYAYCSGCDRDVRVVPMSELVDDAPFAADDPAGLVCLDYGETCTGDMCPVFQTPSAAMRSRLEHVLEAHDDGRPS